MKERTILRERVRERKEEGVKKEKKKEMRRCAEKERKK